MEEKKLIDLGKWLQTQGYEIDLNDNIWMEDCIFQEERIRDIAHLLDDYVQECIIPEIRRRMGMILSEPDGEVRETMIRNLDVYL